MAAFRLGWILLFYVVIVCSALIVTTLVFSLSVQNAAHTTFEALSMLSLTRLSESLTRSFAKTEMATQDVADHLINTAVSAMGIALHGNLRDFEPNWRLLFLTRANSSFVGREELWIDEKTGIMQRSGCYPGSALCFRGDEDEVHIVPVVFGGERFDFTAAEKRSTPYVLGSLHALMMHKRQFSVEQPGYWSPVVMRYTNRGAGDLCGSEMMESVMTFYTCLELSTNGAEPSPSTMYGCKHAVASVIQLRYANQLEAFRVAPTSVVGVLSGHLIDEVEIPSCTFIPNEAYFAMQYFLQEHPEVREATEGTWSDIYFERSYVKSVAAIKTATGAFFLFSDVTPSSFVYETLLRDRDTCIAIASTVIVAVALAGIFIWHGVSRPLQRICRSMKLVSLGIPVQEADPYRYATNRMLGVLEVKELYARYLDLCQALTELKAFAPQGLLFDEGIMRSPTDEFAPPASPWSCNRGSGIGSFGKGIAGMSAFGSAKDVMMHETAETPPSTETVSSHFLEKELSDERGSSGNLSREVFGLGQRSALSMSFLPHSVRSFPKLATVDSQSDGSCESEVSSERRLTSQPATSLSAPTLTKSTTLRQVSCSVVNIFYSYITANSELLQEEMSEFVQRAMQVILQSGGIVDQLRPGNIVVSFGAHRPALSHTRRAVRCAVRLLRHLLPEQRRRATILVDTGVYLAGTCGAYGRYARFLCGDRALFTAQLRNYDLGKGRVIATDSVAQACFSQSFVFLPIENFIPRGNIAAQRYSIQLFAVYGSQHLSFAQRSSVEAYRQGFMHAIRGQYEEALHIFASEPALDIELRDSMTAAMHTLLTTVPRRPRFCRFELPPFEPLGAESAPQGPIKVHKQLMVENLQSEVPEINFLLGTDTVGGTSTATGDRCGTGDALASMYLSLSSPRRIDTGTGTGAVELTSFGPGSWSVAVPPQRPLAATHTNNSPENGSFGFDDALMSMHPSMPYSFRDNKNEEWFIIPRLLGAGSFAKVYKAVSMSGLVAAVKCIQLTKSNINVEDVVSEVNTSCQLLSEHIVNYTGWAHVGTYLNIMMELMPVGSLNDMLQYFPNGLAAPIAKTYAADVLEGLAYLHRNGIVHADLKPQNILLSTDGGCKISDFGSSVTKANVVDAGGDVFRLRGTALYMSPEVARGDAPSAKSDMWSFGITLYEMLTGQMPWAWSPHTRPGCEEDAGLLVAETPRDQIRAGLMNPARFVRAVSRGEVIAIVDRTLLPSDIAAEIISQCLDSDPMKRPHAQDAIYSQYFYAF